MIKNYLKYIKESLDVSLGKDFLIGKTVKMRDDSEYNDEAYNIDANGTRGDGYGKIVDIFNNLGGNHTIIIKWNNGFTDYYDVNDINLIDDDTYDIKSEEIKWYDKGKFIKE